MAGNQAQPIDLTGDSEEEFADANDEDPQPEALQGLPREPEAFLQFILDVVPDISVNHALELLREQNVRNTDAANIVIEQILDGGNYPKEADEVNERKRKAEEGSDEIGKFAKRQQVFLPDYQRQSESLLAQEFPDIPMNHIRNVLTEQKTLFRTHAALEAQELNYTSAAPLFTHLRRRRKAPTSSEGPSGTAPSGQELLAELEAAKKVSKQKAEDRQKKRDEERAEEENLRRAQQNGEMAECPICCEDLPINRMILCNQSDAHIVCRECARRYVEEEVGKMRCHPVCFAVTGCDGTFSRSQLLEFLDPKLFARLEKLQQKEELRKAGLQGEISECPFCDDYSAILPPVDEDKEMRCANPKCKMISCRLCNRKSHIPLSCEEAKKDESISVRHTVEEAKSDAIIRHCNSCKNPFIKEDGCNKMTCSRCGNQQCYVCSKNVKEYSHFGSGNDGKCPLHENNEIRHNQERERAGAEAVAKIRAERPHISEEELEIAVSDRVKEADKARIAQAQMQNAGFPFEMDGNQLRRLHAGAARGHPFIGHFHDIYVDAPPVPPAQPARLRDPQFQAQVPQLQAQARLHQAQAQARLQAQAQAQAILQGRQRQHPAQAEAAMQVHPLQPQQQNQAQQWPGLIAAPVDRFFGALRPPQALAGLYEMAAEPAVPNNNNPGALMPAYPAPPFPVHPAPPFPAHPAPIIPGMPAMQLFIPPPNVLDMGVADNDQLRQEQQQQPQEHQQQHQQQPMQRGQPHMRGGGLDFSEALVRRHMRRAGG